ncbi:MAG: sensor histidine kinase [Pseudomonadota bacterium]
MAVRAPSIPILLRSALALALCGVLGQAWWSIRLDRALTLEAEQRNGLVTVRIMEAHAALSFQNAEQRLKTIATTVSTMSAEEGEIRGIVLAHDLRGNPFLSALQFINPRGESWTSAPGHAVIEGQAGGVAHVRRLLEHPENAELVVGRPYRAAYDNAMVVPLARNLYDDGGRRLGILSIDLRLAFFEDIYAPIAKENDAVVALYANDGFPLVEARAQALPAGVAPPAWRPSAAMPVEAAFEDEASKRLFTYRRVGNLPLTLSYGRDSANVLRAWQKRTQNRLLFSATMLCLLGVLVALVVAQFNRLRRSKAQLQQSQREIEALNADLEMRIAQRTATLEQSNAELGVALSSLKLVQTELFRAEKMASLGSLVAGVAHELNTPIGIGVMMASTLQDHGKEMQAGIESGKLTRSALAEYVANVRSGSEILLRSMDRAAALIQSFKQVAVDQADNERRRFDLRQVMNEVVLAHSHLYRQTRIVLLQDVPSDIMLDSFPGPLGQVLGNLITNAVLHGFDGRSEGTMRLSARLLGTDQVAISFSDDGAGIAPEHLERVFDPFFTTKLGQGGSGLGMHIVYNLVSDVLRGSITLSSEPGQGTRVEIIVPLCVHAQAAPQAQLATPPVHS